MRPQRDRLQAESLFVREGKILPDIAARLRASNKTIWRWACHGKWMERRRQLRLDSPMASLEVLKRQRDKLIQKFTDEKPASPEVLETLNKINRAIEKMEPQRESVDAMLDCVRPLRGVHRDARRRGRLRGAPRVDREVPQ